MKAILCMDQNFNEIENWFNFEDCKKYMLGNLPKKSTIVVDEKLFLSLKKLDIAKDFDIIVFESQKTFVGAKTCKNFLSLEKELKNLARKNARVFVPSGNQVFEKLLPFCSVLSVAKFDKKIGGSKIVKSPISSGDKWIKISHFNSRGVDFETFTNIKAFPLFVMQIKDQLEQEDKKNGNKPGDSDVNFFLDKPKTYVPETKQPETKQEIKKDAKKEIKEENKTEQDKNNEQMQILMHKVLKSKDVKKITAKAPKEILQKEKEKQKKTPGKTLGEKTKKQKDTSSLKKLSKEDENKKETTSKKTKSKNNEQEKAKDETEKKKPKKVVRKKILVEDEETQTTENTTNKIANKLSEAQTTKKKIFKSTSLWEFAKGEI